MSDFDGRKFYGFSLQNDPALTTTTRNFEFKYTRPEHLERVIQRIQHTDQDQDKQKKNPVLSRFNKPKKCPYPQDGISYQSRDADVETHISRGENRRVRELSDSEVNQLIHHAKSHGDIRTSSRSEETYPAKHSSINANFPKSDPTPIQKYQPRMDQQEAASNFTPFHSFTSVDDSESGAHGYTPCRKHNNRMHGSGDFRLEEYFENVHDESDVDLDALMEYATITPAPSDENLYQPCQMSKECFVNKQVVHPPHTCVPLHTKQKLPDLLEEDECGSCTSKTIVEASVEEYRLPEPKWVEIDETNQQIGQLTVEEVKEETTPEETRLATNATYRMHSYLWKLPLKPSAPEMMLDNDKNKEKPRSLQDVPTKRNLDTEDEQPQPDQEQNFYDEDWEYERMDREQYDKLYSSRPKIEEESSYSNYSGRYREFVEIETIPQMNLSFLKTASPLRYSDLTDERDDDKLTEASSFIAQDMKVVIQNKTPKGNMAKPAVEPQAPEISDEMKKKASKTKKGKSASVKANKEKNFEKEEEEAKIQREREKEKAVKTSQKKPTRTPRPTILASAAPNPQKLRERNRLKGGAGDHMDGVSPRDLRTMKILSKSLEALKMEKLAIFTKMTSTQERIIELLDKLRINLMELFMPDTTERNKRQKNAFEFSVRFSRNFLYPLKGMIEDLRLVSKEQLNSALSNEASQRVLNIFMLIHQSLQTYNKQLRLFVIDHVPQKLNALIDLTIAAVNICLEKQVFDRHDAIIECLYDRCTKFLGFLVDMQPQRTPTVREHTKRKQNFEKVSQTKLKRWVKTASNYSLKMFMNDLNMYEPKLVPKNPPIVRHRIRSKPHKPKTSFRKDTPSTALQNNSTPAVKGRCGTIPKTSPHTSQMLIHKSDGDNICTHINEDGMHGSSEFYQSAQNLPFSIAGLTGTISAPPTKTQSPNASSSKAFANLPKLFDNSKGKGLNNALVEALQMVTKEQVRQVLEPIISTFSSALEQKNASKAIDDLMSDFNRNLFSLAQQHGSETQPNTEQQQRGNQDKVHKTGPFTNASKESKAAKQTELQCRQSKPKIDESSKRHKISGSASGRGNAGGGDGDNIDGNDKHNVGGDGESSAATASSCSFANARSFFTDNDADEDVAPSSSNMNAYADPMNFYPNEENEDGPNYSNRGNIVVINSDSQDFYDGPSTSKRTTLYGEFDVSQATSSCDEVDFTDMSGSDFESVDAASSNIDVVLTMKSERHRDNEQQHLKNQQQKQPSQQRQQQQQDPQKHQLQQKIPQQQKKKEIWNPRQQIERSSENSNNNLELERQQQPMIGGWKPQKMIRQLELQEQQLLIQERFQDQNSRLHEQQLEFQQQQIKTIQKQNLQTLKELRCQQLSRESQQQYYMQTDSKQRNIEDFGKKPKQRVSLRPPPTVNNLRKPQNKAGSSRYSDLPSTSENLRMFKKRRNPLLSPPPVPTGTPQNSSRYHKEETMCLKISEDVPLTSPRMLFTQPEQNIEIETNGEESEFYDEEIGDGNYGNTELDAAMEKICSNLSSELMDVAVPLTKTFRINNREKGKTSNPVKTLTKSQKATLVDAVNKCLMKFRCDMSSEFTDETAESEDVDDDSKSVTLYTNQSPYQSPKFQGKKKRQRPQNREQKQEQNSDPQNDQNQNVHRLQDLSEKQEKLQPQGNSTTQKREQNMRNPITSNKIQEKKSPDEPITLIQEMEFQHQRKLQQKQLQEQMLKMHTEEQDQQNQHKQKQQQRPQLQYNQNGKLDIQSMPHLTQNKPRPIYQEAKRLPTKFNSRSVDTTGKTIPTSVASSKKSNLNFGNIINERDDFLRACSKNRFYVNPNFQQPWRVFSLLSQQLANDISALIEEDFTVGVSKFVEDFLETETKI